MAEYLKIIVDEAPKIRFARTNMSIDTAGDLMEHLGEIQFYDASGQSLTANQVLYVSGSQTNGDLFEIRSRFTTNLNGDGFLSVVIRMQYYIPIGDHVDFLPTILGSDPFEFRVYRA